MLGRGVVARPHNAAQRGHQLGPGTAQFLAMMQRQLGEHLLTLGSEREQYLAAVVLRPRAVDKSSRFQTIHQFHGAMVADLHAIRQFADSRTNPGRHALDRQHKLVLAALQSRLFNRLLAEMKEAADLVAELRQRLVIRQGELLHAADCIVPRSSFRCLSIS